MVSKPGLPDTTPPSPATSDTEALSRAETFIASSSESIHMPRSSIRETASQGPLAKRCPECRARYPKDFRVCPRDATLLEEVTDEDPLLGAVVGGSYHLTRVLGEGGMGRVYEARHTRLTNKRFAVKVLHDELARHLDVLARFEREAESASTIAHPNVVDVVDVQHLPDGRPFIVSEYLDGEELGALLDRLGVLPLPAAIRIVRQLCRALGAAHAQGIVHRDMKPENVFLVGDLAAPKVKVIDFGISKQDHGSAKLTRTGMVMGTPSYMSPEQARGEDVDHRTDIYALGGILYRAVTGHKPYDGDDGAMVLTQVLTEDPLRPRAHNPDVPEPLELLIQRAMARDPSERHTTMAELEAELAQLDGPTDPLEGPVPSIPPAAIQAAQKSSSSRDKAVKTEYARQTEREIRRARPILVVVTAFGFLWIIAILVTTVTELLRYSRGMTGRLTHSEALLTLLAVLLGMLTPLALWIRYLDQRVWGNTVTSLALARRARTSLIVGLSVHGLLILLIGLVESAVLRAPAGHLHAAYAGPAALFSLFVAAGTSWYTRRQTKSRTR